MVFISYTSVYFFLFFKYINPLDSNSIDRSLVYCNEFTIANIYLTVVLDHDRATVGMVDIDWPIASVKRVKNVGKLLVGDGRLVQLSVPGAVQVVKQLRVFHAQQREEILVRQRPVELVFRTQRTEAILFKVAVV